MGDNSAFRAKGMPLQQEQGRHDYCNEAVFRRNCLPGRSYYIPDTSVLLNGSWDFHMASTPLEAPNVDESETVSWDKLNVPGHWQLQGHGRPWYTNVQYPIPVCPPQVPTDNPTGTYRRNFTVPAEWIGSSQIRLRFDGVDSAYHVWVNGHLIGYAQGSRNPSEFDITHLVRSNSANEVFVRVYQWSDGTYIEDQDQWWLSGIFRDVHLIALPAQNRIEDWFLKTHFDAKYENAVLNTQVDYSVVEDSTIAITLSDLASNGGAIVTQTEQKVKAGQSRVKIELPVSKPSKWTAETPHLYAVTITLTSQSSSVHTVHQRVGFREVKITDGLLTVNGVPIRLRGVNRHEHHPLFGRAVPIEFAKRDLLTMKRFNINALRLSHQPPDPRVLDLCDELGLWVIGEADLECHGFYDAVARPQDIPEEMDYEKRKKLAFGRAASFTTDNPDWKEAYLDRMRSLVQRDKNHAAIIIWSFGNEAFYGRNFKSMYDYVKEVDPERPIHYEGDAQAETADMYSYMYPSPARLIRHAKETGVNDGKFEKPIILCEYAHAMGNGPGLLDDYEDAFREYPRLQGGFIWEWANHGLWRASKGYYAFGGDDFGLSATVDNATKIHDGTFVMDGLLNSAHEPTHGLIEYKKVIQPIRFAVQDGDVVAENVQDFAGLELFSASYKVEELGSEAKLLASGEIKLPTIGPHQKASLELAAILSQYAKHTEDVHLTVEVRLAEDMLWAEKGHEVAWFQHQIVASPRISALASVGSSILNVSAQKTEVVVSADSFTAVFDRARGHIKKWTSGGQELLVPDPITGTAIIPSFWRPATDNDVPQSLPYWQRFGVDTLASQARSFEIDSSQKDRIIIHTKSFITPPVLAWGWECEMKYTVTASGVLRIDVCSLKPTGAKPEHLPRIGLNLRLGKAFNQVKWYGRGPGESYPDKKSAQKIGIWGSKSVDEMQTPYDVPQENGNRMDTHWVTISSAKSSITAKRVGQSTEEQQFSFVTSHHSDETIQQAQHPTDLVEEDATLLRLDAEVSGVGTAACGPGVRPDLMVKCKETTFSFELQML